MHFPVGALPEVQNWIWKQFSQKASDSSESDSSDNDRSVNDSTDSDIDITDSGSNASIVSTSSMDSYTSSSLKSYYWSDNSQWHLLLSFCQPTGQHILAAQQLSTSEGPELSRKIKSAAPQ